MSAAFDFDLGIEGFRYSDLHLPERLKKLADSFYLHLAAEAPALWAEFQPYSRSLGASCSGARESELLMAASVHLSAFLAKLFRVEAAVERWKEESSELGPIFRFKREFIARRAAKKAATPRVPALELPALERELAVIEAAIVDAGSRTSDPELRVARVVCRLLDLEEALKKEGSAEGPGPITSEARLSLRRLRSAFRDAPSRNLPPLEGLADLKVLESLLEMFERWAKEILGNEPLRRRYAESWVSFRLPEKMHYPDGLVPYERPSPELPSLIQGHSDRLRRRDGFKLTDPRWSGKEALDHAHYCVICHERGKDSCTRGYPLPRKQLEGEKNPLGVTLNGCPLRERISEMHALRRTGDSIAAIAVVMIDNPMCPATGHRICNDCMKACIFQKQEPVNIPQIETRCLTEVLSLPYGFEIYSLLARWNPLNVKRPYPLPYNGKNVLVVGLGPAGINLAHWLLNEGFGVVGIDGLKIEPLDPDLIGQGGKTPRPVRNLAEIQAELDERIGVGFGGVAEYGITVRWDKNFLTVMDITLRRREKFRVYGGVRFGGTIEIDDAWDLGFDHIAVAAGAGRPSVVDMRNSLCRNVRTASDFLMALQLTGAFKRSSMANLHLELPCVVIGSGLTAIDTATEAMAYYPLQVEKVLARSEILAAELGEEELWAHFKGEEPKTLETFLEHGKEIRRERERARAAGETPNFIPLLRRWGGVTICYRKRLVDSPAYRLNHEEIIKCFEEGVEFMENVSPVEAVPDAAGAVSAVLFEKIAHENGSYRPTGETIRVEARTVFMAAGTTPNIIYEKEHPGTFQVDPKRRCFLAHRLVWKEGSPQLEPAKATLEDPGFFTSYLKNGKLISFFGDNHPFYAGSVVKAMASAKEGFPEIVKLFQAQIRSQRPEDQAARERAWGKLIAHLDRQLVARVVKVVRLTPKVVEVVVRAPCQASKFHPGQFYRLQNYEVNSQIVAGSRLQMEGIALTGAWVDRKEGLLGLIVLELGVSSRLCAFLQEGEEVVLMGPTGAPTEIPKGGLTVLCGGGLGNAVLFSIAKALRESGAQVLYFAGYKQPLDLFHQDNIEQGSEQVVWSVDQGEVIRPRRPQDRTFVGNIVDAMVAYARGELGGSPLFSLRDARRIITIGSDRMMAAVTHARKGVLVPYLNPAHVAISSINSPMQCMMKEICGQCLQSHVDPVTGQPDTYVFSCFNQDQESDRVDWKNLSDRLGMNTLEEKIANLWLDHLIPSTSSPRRPEEAITRPPGYVPSPEP
jgi:NADPH-dependent glutamate synthase beta subunit-like oxidoreductase/NAD(P)H-flavin reductase